MDTKTELWDLADSRGLVPVEGQIVTDPNQPSPRIRATNDRDLAEKLWGEDFDWDPDREQFVPTKVEGGLDLAERSRPASTSGAGPTDPPVGPGEVRDYESWRVVDLRSELDNRDLPIGGHKAELVDRLQASDKARQAETGEG